MQCCRGVVDAIVRDSMAGIMLGQCSMLCRESPRDLNACMKHLVKRRIIAVREYGEGTCIGCSMDLVRSVIMGKTCIG